MPGEAWTLVGVSATAGAQPRAPHRLQTTISQRLAFKGLAPPRGPTLTPGAHGCPQAPGSASPAGCAEARAPVQVAAQEKGPVPCPEGWAGLLGRPQNAAPQEACVAPGSAAPCWSSWPFSPPLLGGWGLNPRLTRAVLQALYT